MHEAPRRTISASDVGSPFPGADAAAFAALDQRVLAYPLGSGQAEEIALRAGLRPMIRQLLLAKDLERMRETFEARGFVTRTATSTYGPTRDGWVGVGSAPISDEQRTPLFIGRDRAAVDEAAVAEAARSADDHRTLGRLLGYPRCCVESFVSVPGPRRNDEVFAAAVRNTRAFVPRLNVLDLGIFHWISWVPCSFDCSLSLRYADALAQIVAGRHPAFARTIDVVLAAHRLVLHDDVQLSIHGVLDGPAIEVAHLWPTARHRHPTSPVSADARDATARALTFLRGTRRIEITSDTLIADGTRVALAVPARVFPFGVEGVFPSDLLF